MKSLIRFLNGFAKVTGFPVQYCCFRTKVSYKDRAVQGRGIRGPAIIVSNHTSVYDYAVWIFVFYGRTLRVPMAEVLFEKQPLGAFLKAMGGIKIDRNSHTLAGLDECADVISDGGTVLIFPEGRIPRKEEERPLEFRSGAAALALATGAPIIPVYTNGSYFGRKRARVAIGTPVFAADLADESAGDTENLRLVSAKLKDLVSELRPLTEAE